MDGRSAPRVLTVGLAGLCLVTGPMLAQDRPGQGSVARARLTVRPLKMPTADRTIRAGTHKLDSTATIYVPEACVGSRRCPLVVGLFNGSNAVYWLREGADKYGMIVLDLSRWKSVFGRNVATDGPRADITVGIIDRALKQVLPRFAIDPAKIAIVGRCGGGMIASMLGFDNVEVFSRVAVISGGTVRPHNKDPRNTAVEYVYTSGFFEGSGPGFPRYLKELHQAGYPTKIRLALRGHEHQREDYYFFMRWLHESWATPSPADRPAPPLGADPMPRLTPEALAQMTAFWTRFTQLLGTKGEPYRPSPNVDSVLMAARRSHLRELTVPFDEVQPAEQLSVVLVDIAALAADVPAVAAALKEAGLTAQQHDAYRIALISAIVNEKGLAGAVAPTSTLGKNIALLAAHPVERKALEETGIWRLP